MQHNNRQLRTQLRWIHILASALLGMFLYSPWRSSQTLAIAISCAVFPILTLTGVWMWQGAKIKKWLTKSSVTKTNSTSINYSAIVSENRE